MMKPIVPVILCGGSGTRLWPLSRSLFPKQFVPFDNNESLFAKTLDRIKELIQDTSPIIVCNEEHRFHALMEIEAHNCQPAIILEPCPRNTAPAIALAALAVESEDPNLLIMPSDHFLPDHATFCQKVREAAPLSESGHIVAFGIKPTSPTTGYGYIVRGGGLKNGFIINKFIEKPDQRKAASLIAQGNCFWNSGIFLCRASTYLRELARFAPHMHASCQKAWSMKSTDGAFIRPHKEEFAAISPDSIDYAIMEKTEKAAVFPLALEWNDLGTWDAIFERQPADVNGNVIHGDVLEENAKNCYLDSRHRLLAALDVNDLVVVETQDAVLVTSKNHTQNVKKIVSQLDSANRPESSLHPVVHRPWGSYETLVLSDRFQVKRIIVNPGAQLSLQMHHHRAEHWVVVNGTAEVINGESSQLLTENQSTYIPIGEKHSLKNPGLIPLEIIEIQSGSYLGENDIIRFSDIYGR